MQRYSHEGRVTWCAKLRIYKRLERLVAIIILAPFCLLARAEINRRRAKQFQHPLRDFLLFSTASLTWPRCGDRSALTNTLIRSSSLSSPKFVPLRVFGFFKLTIDSIFFRCLPRLTLSLDLAPFSTVRVAAATSSA